jgi:hypothetical protein
LLGGEGASAVEAMIAKGSATTYWENGVEMMTMQKHEAGQVENYREQCRVNKAVPIILQSIQNMSSSYLYRITGFMLKQTCVEHNNNTFSRGRKQSPTRKLRACRSRCAKIVLLRCQSALQHHSSRIPKDPKVATLL